MGEAQLDRSVHYGEYTGGTSDPRLVHKVNLIPPYIPTTDAQRASVAAQIRAAFPDTERNAHLTAREELLNMILNGWDGTAA